MNYVFLYSCSFFFIFVRVLDPDQERGVWLIFSFSTCQSNAFSGVRGMDIAAMHSFFPPCFVFFFFSRFVFLFSFRVATIQPLLTVVRVALSFCLMEVCFVRPVWHTRTHAHSHTEHTPTTHTRCFGRHSQHRVLFVQPQKPHVSHAFHTHTLECVLKCLFLFVWVSFSSLGRPLFSLSPHLLHVASPSSHSLFLPGGGCCGVFGWWGMGRLRGFGLVGRGGVGG